MSEKGPVVGTRIAGGRYYLIRAEGKRRVWIKLTKVKEGLPAFYRALAAAQEHLAGYEDAMPRLISDWQRDVMALHAPSTRRDETAMGNLIAARFIELRASEIRSPDVADYLRDYRDRPRTHNAHRGLLRELMRYAEERGFREPGTNPVAAIRTMSTPPRDRYITDEELQKIKDAAMVGKPRKQDKEGDDEAKGAETRSGPMVCALIDMAYLTGQRIGDLLALQWSAIGAEGITFQPAKTKGSTGARVLIEWTPSLRALVVQLKTLRLSRPGVCEHVFTTQDGREYTYWGASTAWRRACERAKVKAHFHDLRAKALTDKEAREGMQAARTMGAHSTEQQTAGYVRHKTARKTGATR